jgi:lysozyme
MPVVVPNSKPRLSSTALRKLIESFQIDRTKFPVVVIGIRGYYLNTLGKAGANDRGIYDDALFIDTPQATVSFNANTDPTSFRKGKGKGSTKGMAILKPGLWMVHKFGLHKGKYLALVQRLGHVTVIRDGDPDYEDTGDFGINIHKGGLNSTGSEGCQTIHPAQWDSFITLVKDQVVRYHGTQWNKVIIPYVLIENKGNI